MKSTRTSTILAILMMAVLATLGGAQTVDDFNRTTLGTNWTADPEYVIVSNTLDNSATTANWSYLAVFNALANPFEVSFKWASTGDVEGVNSGGVALLLSTASTSANGYFIMRRYGSIDLNPIVSGVVDRTVTIHSVTPATANPAPGSIIKVVFRTDASAYYFDVYHNGTLDGTVKDTRTSRPSIPSPYYAGVCLYGNRNNNIDDFTVRAQTITVTAPNGGEVWLANSTHSITWTNGDFTSNVKLEYSTNGGSTWSTIVASVANTGSYSWTVPTSASTQCRVRVQDASDGVPSDISNANFEIQPEVDEIRVISPNGGENWIVNTDQEIRWYGTSMVPFVKIYYSIDNGATWSLIVSSTPNDGSFTWTVPAPLTNQAFIRITDLDGLPTDVSDAAFAISALVSLRIPNSSGQPGSTGNTVNIWMDNQTNVRGVSLKLTDSPNLLTAMSAVPVGRASGFSLVKSDNGTSVTLFLVHMSGGVISVGSGPIMQISYDVAGGATLGTFSTLDMSNVTISDANSNLVVPELISGEFHYVMTGDLDANGIVNLADLNRAADIALKRGTPASNYEQLSGDVDHDGDFDLYDFIAIWEIVY